MGGCGQLCRLAVDLNRVCTEEQIIHLASKAELERLAEPHLHGHCSLRFYNVLTHAGALRAAQNVWHRIPRSALLSVLLRLLRP